MSPVQSITFAGKWLCPRCGAPHEEHRSATFCCLAEGPSPSPITPMLLDETDRREAVLETELEQARKSEAESSAIIARLNETVGAMDARLEANRIDGALREASLLARAEKAERERDEARKFAEDLSKRAGCWKHGTAPDAFCPYCGAMGAVVARAEKAEAGLESVLKDKAALLEYSNELLGRALRAEAALRKCVEAMDRVARLLEQHWANGMGRPPGNRPEWFDEALAAARDVIGG